jgi:molybdopterin synthase catalytic subunit
MKPWLGLMMNWLFSRQSRGAEVGTRVAVQPEDFDLSTEVAALRQCSPHGGAVVAFVGTVREHQPEANIDALELEHYPGMTERAIEALINEASARFDIGGVRVIHRVGWLPAAAQIMMVAVTSTHRAPAFLACEFLMDGLKTSVPFWKKEHTLQGARWVEARASDEQAQARWAS